MKIFEGQNYNDVKNEFSKYKRIVICGPNRSGTTFFSKALAKDLGYRHYDEAAHAYNKSLPLFNNLLKEENIVIQAPGMIWIAHRISQIFEDALVVVMTRDIDDIMNSSIRIRNTNKPNIPAFMNLVNTRYKSLPELVPHVDAFLEKNQPIQLETSAIMRYTIWDQFQRDATENYIELEYESLKTHPRWINKEDRKNFKPKQTS